MIFIYHDISEALRSTNKTYFVPLSCLKLSCVSSISLMMWNTTFNVFFDADFCFLWISSIIFEKRVMDNSVLPAVLISIFLLYTPQVSMLQIYRINHWILWEKKELVATRTIVIKRFICQIFMTSLNYFTELHTCIVRNAVFCCCQSIAILRVYRCLFYYFVNKTGL